MSFWNKIKERKLIDLLPNVKGKYLINVPLSKYTRFKVGGPAEVLFVPQDEEDLINFLKKRPKNMPLCLIGGGSNLLIRDGGIPGVVIKLDSPYFRQAIFDKNTKTVKCFAGMKNFDLKKIMLENQVGGLEFLCSIPGVIGGSIKTNSGCYGKEIKDYIVGATILDEEANLLEIGPEDLKLGYRSSLFPDSWIIISITLKTEPKTKQEVLDVLEEQKKHRMKSQPFDAKTAGSTFKNPQGFKAWELIKKSGADKLKVGGARVSEKHCNFLINDGTATAKDIETLGEQIIAKVKEKTSIVLEWEVKRMGIE